MNSDAFPPDDVPAGGRREGVKQQIIESVNSAKFAILVAYMRVALAGQPFLIAGIAAFAACLTLAQSQPPTMNEGFVDVPGAKIYYKDSAGRGTPVIFLHAFTGSTEVWEQQIPVFTRAGYRFIAFERRGFGRTVADANGPASTGPDDLLALADHLKIDKFHLIGTAGGGFVALDFVISYPERVRSFTLLCSQGGVQDEDYQAALKRLATEGFEKMPESFRELSPSYRVANPEGTERWSEFQRRNRAPEAVRGPAQPVKNRVTLALLESIRIPTLVIAGDADLYAPPALMRRIADRIKGAEFVVIPDAGHSVWWEAPDEFNRTVLTFITRH
jgi:pimeloyl-ACP methyl ester carboxylesterase